ncbi:MAG: phosphotransferase [Actinomycetota bacterium]
MAATRGRELGRGLRSVVYEWGEVDVVKIAAPSTPTSWIVEELRLTDTVARLGAPVPDRRRLVEVDGRTALAAERIGGPSLWDELAHLPDRATELGESLARLHLDLVELSVSYDLPRQHDRVESKIRAAASRHGADLLDAIGLLPGEQHTDVLCHGDLHPRNVLLGRDGPVVVDWFDCCRGSLLGEIARTALVIDTSRDLGGRSVPRPSLSEFRSGYLTSMRTALDIDDEHLADWTVLAAVARIAEDIGDIEVESVRRDLRRRVDLRAGSVS